MRVGFGFDVHEFIDNRPLIIGGVEIPHARGLAGHSDADVLIHAVMDALLGAAGLDDIGVHFPNTDPKFQGIQSRILLRHVRELMDEHRYGICNIDATIVAQTPKLRPYTEAMKQNIAEDLNIDFNQINIKATTTEHLGFIGRREGIATWATALIDYAPSG